MSHNEKRSDWKREWLCATLSGFLFGGTCTIVGHPFDTVKTKMQVQSGHTGLGISYSESVKQVMRQEGPLGFYRGGWPPFFGSVLYRSV